MAATRFSLRSLQQLSQSKCILSADEFSQIFCKRYLKTSPVYANRILINRVHNVAINQRIVVLTPISSFCLDIWGQRSFHTSRHLESKDFYKILGVPRNASTKEIKKAYYELAKKYHPDKNKGDQTAATKFAEAAEAYEVLGDKTKRQEYDTMGTTGFGGGGGFQGMHGTNIDPEELFRTVFGGKGGFSNIFEGAGFGGIDNTREYMMDLTFSESARGVNKEIEIKIDDVCERCNGARAEPGTKTTRCHRCQGTGMETINTGPFMMRSTCRQCRGQGTIINVPCILCKGSGQTMQKKKVVVPVPAGVENGQTVRLPVGSREIFITFRVARSNTFRRDGADVHSDVSVTYTQAALGGSLRVKGLYDSIHLNIPAGTQSHTRIRLPGKGIQRMNGYGNGDHYVHIKIKVPTKLTDKQKGLLLSFAEEEEDVVGTVNGISKTQDGNNSQSEDSYVDEDEEVERKPGFLERLANRVFGRT
ncbi:dnaJ homolog subfamily A member 3, mitochondrial-like isoform X2 [Anneissia japonica]|uniref:dnaJ homolog subfamily A member 3, mitochondrial-like isoform X2 n=1 Tax=Anneissia japonica TaxID=1529436 RepID=UPI001425A2AB|nr:dnaJ homolog subfamily A member 3, mitochondrial-like isoform X2 [Anneissia japonica]